MFLFIFPVCVMYLFGLFSMYNFDLHLEGNMTICFCIKDIVTGFFPLYFFEGQHNERLAATNYGSLFQVAPGCWRELTVCTQSHHPFSPNAGSPNILQILVTHSSCSPERI